MYENNYKYNTAIQGSISAFVQESINYCDSLLVDPQLNVFMGNITSSSLDSQSSDLFIKLNYKLLAALEYRNEIAGISVISEDFVLSKGNIANIKYEEIIKDAFFADMQRNPNQSVVLQGKYDEQSVLNRLGRNGIYVAALVDRDGRRWIVLLKLNPDLSQ